MAGGMIAADMKAAVAAAIIGVPEASRNFDAMWLAICQALVTYITTNAVVHVTSVTGVTAGAGVSGTGFGTIT